MDIIYRLFSDIGFNHPLHPPLTHMPAGLIVGAFLFLIAALFWKKQDFRTTAFDCLVLAMIFLFPTAFLGITDWLHFYSGIWSFPIKIKIVLTMLLLILLILAVIIQIKKIGGIMKFSIYFLSFFVVIGLGYFGGQIVYGNNTSQSVADLRQGEKMYLANCNTCHPKGSNIITPALPVINSMQLKDLSAFIKYMRNPQHISGPQGKMPAFLEDKLSDQDLKQMYQYIKNELK